MNTFAKNHDVKTNIPAIALLLIILSSCQKELSSENNPPPNGTNTTDSNYLYKDISVYDHSTGGPADSSVDTYTYDTRKRVTQLKTVYYPDSGAATDSSEVSFYYNGTDTLPNKLIDQGIQFGSSTYSDVHFPTYDAQGRFVYDSSIVTYNGPTTTIIQTIVTRTFKSAYVIFTQKDSAIVIAPNSSVHSYTVDTGWTDPNQNIIKNNNWEEGYSTPFISNKGNYTYDNKPSPYTRLNIFNLLYNIHSIKEFFSPQYNNIVSYYNEDYGYGSPPIIYSISFTNTYNSQGLIIKAIGTNNYGDPTRKYFLYKKL
jgi:hypothetical protein